MNLLFVILFLFTVPATAQKPVKKAAARPPKHDDIILCGVNETEPIFAGGKISFKQFLERHLNIDSLQENNLAPPGCQTLHLEFIVDRDGRLSDIAVQNDSLVYPGYVSEALRVLRLSPRWKPATQNGRPVKSYRQQPITFCIQGDDSTGPAVPDTAIVPAVFPAGNENMQIWFTQQLEKIPVQQWLPGSQMCFNAAVEARFMLDSGVAVHIELLTTGIPAAVEKEMIRLIQTPGIWKPVLPGANAPGKLAPTVIYALNVAVTLDKRRVRIL